MQVQHAERERDIYFPPDRLVPADIALVFGMNSPARPAMHAIRLWRQGYVKRLLFTGGYNPRLGATEAGVMAGLAGQEGVPRDAILLEPCAAHTDQNAEFAARLLAGEPGRGLLIVAVHFHLRRCRLAAQRWFGPQAVRGWSSYSSRYYRAEDWPGAARARQDVAGESEKIRRYYADAAPFSESLDLV